MTHFTVLGATGFIGSHLVALLDGQGETVDAPQRDSVITGDADYGHVIYCVGLTADFRSRPFDTVRAHVSELSAVLERARFESFTYLSSTRVYLGADTASEDTELRVSPLRSDDLYNLTKLTGEALCLRVGGEKARVVRLSNVYGDDLRPNTFLSEVVKSALERGEVVLQDHPDSEKDYVHVEDVVELLPRIATRATERVYNVASGVNVSNRALLEVIQRETNCRIETNPAAPLKRFAPVDVTRMRSEFGVVASRNVLDELPELIRGVAA